MTPCSYAMRSPLGLARWTLSARLSLASRLVVCGQVYCSPLNFLDPSSTLPRHFIDTSSTLPRHFLDTSSTLPRHFQVLVAAQLPRRLLHGGRLHQPRRPSATFPRDTCSQYFYCQLLVLASGVLSYLLAADVFCPKEFHARARALAVSRRKPPHKQNIGISGTMISLPQGQD